jgi:hypothetical protein
MFNFFNRNKDYFSQSGQDQFAYNISGNNGIYLEIGAHHPLLNSNTYNLEVECDWKGLSVEFDKSFKKFWDNSKKRNNPVIWDNAFKIDYLASFEEYVFPKRINYLSCDIEPPKNTFEILKKIIEIGLSFDFISFEHDLYSSGNTYEKLSYDFLLNKGYKVGIRNVYSRSKKYKIYETWFVNKDIKFNEVTYEYWKKHNYSENIFRK